MGKTAKNIDLQATLDDLAGKVKRDPESLGRLYDIYYDRIYRYCLRRVFDLQAAEDVTSQVFLQVAKNIQSFRGSSGEDFQGWLYVIASNQINTYLRQKGRRGEIMEQVSRSIAMRESYDNHEHLDWPILYSCISKLKPNLQTMVTLRYFEGMSYEQIGRAADVKPATVGVHLHRAIRKLREEYDSQTGGTHYVS